MEETKKKKKIRHNDAITKTACDKFPSLEGLPARGESLSDETRSRLVLISS